MLHDAREKDSNPAMSNMLRNPWTTSNLTTFLSFSLFDVGSMPLSAYIADAIAIVAMILYMSLLQVHKAMHT